ncbi:radical SAM protein [Streptococcus thoraltensis]|uniref:radical SAM protein n=1 Tax=Streptococcus thoraltensis TaxID=55085 RepID=UPI00036EFBBD|nr:radical SAM protein [Streptococcus thoraltensis]
MNDLEPKPRTAAILMTYQCVAECDECCFSCSPRLKGTSLNFDTIKNFLNKVKELGNVKVVVFSGGECFIEFKLLVQSIKYAHDLGFLTRCVTNGFWGTSLESARKRVKFLKESGLSEINFSTGDSHQKFVPVENVLRCSIASIEQGLLTCVAVETNSSKKFKVEDFINHSLYSKYIKNKKYSKLLKVMPTIWVSFHTDTVYNFDKSILKGNDDGCDGIFDTVALEPRGDVVGCCGLTSNDISELHLGKVIDSNLDELLSVHHNDFLKIWIFVEGPKKIVETASKWSGEPIPNFAHKCLYCAYLYNDVSLLEAIKAHYLEIREDILKRYLEKVIVFNSINT